MPPRPAVDSPEASDRTGAAAATARKARFWDRTAVKYAASPIADRVGYEMLATDVAAGMIAIAREKLAVDPLPQLRFAVADADLPMAGVGVYDAVLAFNVLHLVADLDRALELAVQALRPGGLLISKTACLLEMNPLIHRLALPVMRAIGKAPDVLCFDAATLQAAIARHGMHIVSVERHGSRGKDFRVFIVARKPA
jgi:SAM-dependent methyltransferase